jgi:chromatin segregation and condensation protein Rec8/ScpA/Scc1 (kleisin family)
MALRRLDQSGQPINFASVAQAASVSRKWLYRVPELRDAIMALRVNPPRPHPTVPSRQRATAESLRRRLETALAELNHLRQENTRLRDELARHYGQQRARKAYQPPHSDPHR